MALDLYAGDRHEAIGTQDEFLLQLADADPAKYPQLGAISARLYDGPRLSAEQAGLVVHELIDLLAEHGGTSSPALARVALRLMSFFSVAHRAGLEIRGHSD